MGKRSQTVKDKNMTMSSDIKPVSLSETELFHQASVLLGATCFIWDGAKAHVWVDALAAAELLHVQVENLPATRDAYDHRLTADAARARANALRQLTWDGAQYCISYEIQTFDDQTLWLEERGQRLSGTGQTPDKIIAVIRNISTQKRDHDKTVHSYNFDELTGLWSAERLHGGLSYLLSIAKRTHVDAGLLRLQVINLEDVNTTYGFETGDRLLKAIGARLNTFVKAPDILARLADTGFAIGLLQADAQSLENLAQSLVSELSDTPYPSPHGELYAEFAAGGTLLKGAHLAHEPQSRLAGDNLAGDKLGGDRLAGDKARNIGATLKPDYAVTADDALLQARIALEESVRHRGDYIAYHNDLNKNWEHKKNYPITSEAILAALNDRRISLAYQPIVDAKTRELHHYECLLRLRRDNGEIVSAGQIIMAAEKLDLVHFLDRRALELASVTLLRDSSIRLALNLSAGTVKNMKAADAYLDALKALGPAAQRVTLELTETVALDDPAMANRFCVEARQLGTDFAIDDFGSGYTTFQNLMAIEADTIKIDGSFIQDLAVMPHKQTFVRMMVDLAQTFNVKTVAEMVDSRDNADLLMRLGVDYLQGYLFGIPSAAPAWLGTDKPKLS